MPKTSINSKGYKEIGKDGLMFLKSYNTFVAYCNSKIMFVTTEWSSQTTTRHINLFKGRFNRNIVKVSQSLIEDIVREKQLN